MIRELIKLPYAYNPLEPMMSSETLQYHHDKHYSGYISNLFPELTTPSPALDSILYDEIHSANGYLFRSVLKQTQLLIKQTILLYC